MDPTETLRNALTAILDGDRETATESLWNLGQWIERYGFLPDVDIAILSLPTVSD